MEIKRTTCNRDCPDACGMLATVEGGRVVRLAGDPDHPVTRGFLCYRTNKFLKRQYDPDRLTTPLIRNGDGFREASWDEALDLIAETMLRIREESGGQSILHYRCGGSLGIVKHVTDWYFRRFGPVAEKSGDICAGAGEAAQTADFGTRECNDLFDLLNSRTIVLWGKNPWTSVIHLVPILKEARGRGARIVQIDPVRHRGADFADLYLQPRPGGDIALGLGLARLLFERAATDPEAGSYCDNLHAFRDLAYSRTPGEWASIADVPATDLEAFATMYAEGPSNIQVGWGMQRRTHGSAAIRVLDAVTAVSGNLGVSGGGVSFCYGRRDAFDFSHEDGTPEPPRRFPEPLLGPAILEADPPVRMVWVSYANPVVNLPDSLAVKRALESREFTVVVDAFPTDTARCAHVVLPTTTMLEDDDLVGSYGHHWIGEVRPVVAPPDGVKTDYEITQALARRTGLGGEFSDDVSTWKERLLSRVAKRGLTPETLSRGAVRNPDAAEVLFADRRFPTPTGRVNLVHDLTVDPPKPTGDYPLLLNALATPKAQCAQWPSSTQVGPAPATVHPESSGGFSEGDTARLESEHGSMEVVLRFDSGQRRDILLMDKGGWLHAGRCANVLIPARSTDAGGGAVYYDTPVRLARLEGAEHART